VFRWGRVPHRKEEEGGLVRGEAQSNLLLLCERFKLARGVLLRGKGQALNIREKGGELKKKGGGKTNNQFDSVPLKGRSKEQPPRLLHNTVSYKTVSQRIC